MWRVYERIAYYASAQGGLIYVCPHCEATHEIVLMGQADAQELLSFLEMLLKFIYEFPNRVPSVP